MLRGTARRDDISSLLYCDRQSQSKQKKVYNSSCSNFVSQIFASITPMLQVGMKLYPPPCLQGQRTSVRECSWDIFRENDASHIRQHDEGSSWIEWARVCTSSLINQVTFAFHVALQRHGQETHPRSISANLHANVTRI